MIVSRYNGNTDRIEIKDKPFKISYRSEELIFVFDQSSTCTALTIGNLKGHIKELITFERENRKGETVDAFLAKLEHWVKVLIAENNVVCYGIEETVKTNYTRSDQVTKQVRGVMVNIYQTAQCKDAEGNVTFLTNNSEIEEVHNKEWKAMSVPIDYFRHYKDDKVAVHTFFTKHFPMIARMKQDISDSIGMYFFLIKTKYGTQKLKANKSSVVYNHSVVVMAFPFEELRKSHKPLAELAKSVTDMKFNEEQLKYIDEYKKSVVKRYIALLNGYEYMDEYIASNKNKVDTALAMHLKMKPQEEFESLKRESRHLSLVTPEGNELDRGIREFEFNDALTLEENLRCFTGRNRDIYYTVMPKSLHYCYTIPMFDLLLGLRDNILIIATRL